MADKDRLYFLTMREAGQLMRSGQLSPVELLRACLDRIEATDDRLHSFVTLMADEAMEQARTAESEMLRGNYRGPMHGIPFALKDLYDTAGTRTTSGSYVDLERVPAVDATTTAGLKNAGGILVGKLAMHEFALGGPDWTTPFEPARNPGTLTTSRAAPAAGPARRWLRGRSWAASAPAPAAPYAAPASYCGIVGLKPTYGRVSRFGVVTLSWSQDHAGPMTWTVEDCGLHAAGHRRPRSRRTPPPAQRRCPTTPLRWSRA